LVDDVSECVAFLGEKFEMVVKSGYFFAFGLVLLLEAERVVVEQVDLRVQLVVAYHTYDR
jgi:hypothetical protein